jgi:hypothetical protein
MTRILRKAPILDTQITTQRNKKLFHKTGKKFYNWQLSI